MTDTAAILRDLTRAKAVFQIRAITAALGLTPDATREERDRGAGEGDVENDEHGSPSK